MNRWTFFTLAVWLMNSGHAGEEPLPWIRHTIDPWDKAAGKRGADGVRLTDVNGDGMLDVTTGWEEGGAIRVCLNPGTEKIRKVWPAVTVGMIRGAEDAVSVDIDSDGTVDVVSCAEGKTNQVFIHWAPSEPTSYLVSGEWKTQSLPATTLHDNN